MTQRVMTGILPNSVRRNLGTGTDPRRVVFTFKVNTPVESVVLEYNCNGTLGTGAAADTLIKSFVLRHVGQKVDYISAGKNSLSQLADVSRDSVEIPAVNTVAASRLATNDNSTTTATSYRWFRVTGPFPAGEYVCTIDTDATSVVGLSALTQYDIGLVVIPAIFPVMAYVAWEANRVYSETQLSFGKSHYIRLNGTNLAGSALVSVTINDRSLTSIEVNQLLRLQSMMAGTSGAWGATVSTTDLSIPTTVPANISIALNAATTVTYSRGLILVPQTSGGRGAKPTPRRPKYDLIEFDTDKDM